MKKCVPISRSNIDMNWAPAMNGVAATTRAEVVRFAHTRSGMRKSVMPGARIVAMVARKFTAVAIDEAPANWMPSENIVWPNGDCSDSVG